MILLLEQYPWVLKNLLYSLEVWGARDWLGIAIRLVSIHSSIIRGSPDPAIQKLLPSCRRTQTLGKEALERLSSLYKDGGIEGGVASLSHISTSADSTTKLLLKLADGLEVETVIIPWNGKRSTLCISSQVGCLQGCRFCATGKMSLLRSLSSDEILSQLFFAKKVCRINGLPQISSVVFMGMGEPGDNLDAVIRATEILTTRELFQLSASKVTVSSVSPTPDTFRQLGKAPCVLAWSVHAANDKLRKSLVPTTKYTMAELRQGMMDALLDRPRNVRATMWEVALIAGVNDSMEAADELADFARVFVDGVPGVKLIVNLIPFNDIGHPVFRKTVSRSRGCISTTTVDTRYLCSHSNNSGR